MADSSSIAEGVERCPFLRNINEPTLFSFSTFPSFHFPALAKGGRGPIFEDGPNFETAFRFFHGRDGVVPLSESKLVPSQTSLSSNVPRHEAVVSVDNKVRSDSRSCPALSNSSFNPLASSAASISLSAFGAFGPFSFDAFLGKGKWQDGSTGQSKGKKKEPTKRSNSKAHSITELHEAAASEWLSSGNCPIAKSYRAVGGVLPLVAKWLKPPPGMKYKCPPAIVAARAALARTAFAKSLRPQPLPSKVLAIGLLGMAVNVPLGVWREHTIKFSPSWFVAVHASVPFVAMLRKAVNMPKYAMAFTIASAILGQFIGSRAERHRLKTASSHAIEEVEVPSTPAVMTSEIPQAFHINKKVLPARLNVERENTETDSLVYQCAKEVLDATTATTSSSAIGAF